MFEFFYKFGQFRILRKIAVDLSVEIPVLLIGKVIITVWSIVIEIFIIRIISLVIVIVSFRVFTFGFIIVGVDYNLWEICAQTA